MSVNNLHKIIRLYNKCRWLSRQYIYSDAHLLQQQRHLSCIDYNYARQCNALQAHERQMLRFCQPLNSAPIRLYSIPHDGNYGYLNDIVLDQKELCSFEFAETDPDICRLGICPCVPLLLIDKALFPKFMKVIEINSSQMLELLRRRFELQQPYVGVFLAKNTNEAHVVKSLRDVHLVGVFAHIHRFQDLGDRMHLVVQAHSRIRIKRDMKDNTLLHLAHKRNREQNADYQKYQSYHYGRTKINNTLWRYHQDDYELEENKDKQPDEEEILMVEVQKCAHFRYRQTIDMKSKLKRIRRYISKVISMNALHKDTLDKIIHDNQHLYEDPIFVCDLVATISTADGEDVQAILEEPDISQRVAMAIKLLYKEINVCKIQQQIGEEIEAKIRGNEHKLILNEQMKIIKKELGIESEQTDKNNLEAKFRERLLYKIVPKYALNVINDELDKLHYLENNSPEFNITCTYLNWLVDMPWGVKSTENLNIESVSNMLNSKHYGIDNVKESILEFIAVSLLKGQTQGRILCLYGPPGVGKTSIARSIACALNRPYYRFSVAGITDAAEIKGHRRTYVGAMPGKIIQCLKQTQTENPVLLIDEIDKIHNGIYSNTGSAILESFDKQQNNAFYDYYLDMPVNLSQVLFICTANVPESIPEVLRDRMELIEISGYVDEEKLNILRLYIIPKCLKSCGLKNEQFKITNKALKYLIRNYSLESGVRHLEILIEKMIHKIAYDLMNSKDSKRHFYINHKKLIDYVGKPICNTNRIYKEMPTGVAIGLTWTALGGAIMYIETAKYNDIDKNQNLKYHIGNINVTGNLGSIMKESAQIALTVARNLMYKIDENNNYLENKDIHMHIPQGAIHKDGPSAGVTITTALISLAINKKLPNNMAITGEITLCGKILAIKHLKEKIIAAKRHGIKHIILPIGNKLEYMALSTFITNNIHVYYANTYYDVLQLCFNVHLPANKFLGNNAKNNAALMKQSLAVKDQQPTD